jgi:hypothetical protein
LEANCICPSDRVGLYCQYAKANTSEVTVAYRNFSFYFILEKKLSNLKLNSSLTTNEVEALKDLNKIMAQNPDFFSQSLTDLIYNITGKNYYI